MTTSELQPAVLAAVTTVADKSNLEASIQMVIKKVLNSATKVELDNLLSVIPVGHKSVLSALFTSDQSLVQKNVQMVQQLLAGLPIATLTITYMPTQKQIVELATLLRKKTNPSLVLDIRQDPSIGAGYILEATGRRTATTLADLTAAI